MARLISLKAPHNWTPKGGDKVVGRLGGKYYVGIIESRIGQPKKPQMLRISSYQGADFQGVWIKTPNGARIVV
jgi:hypothetical protein